ncbi:MAG: transcription antitermination protein NusB [Phycisphaerales bacterium]
MTSDAQRPRHIRRLAFELLFALDAIGSQTADAPTLELAIQSSQTAELLNEGGRAKAIRIADSAWTARRHIDATLAQVAPQWPTHRMPATDRAIVRLAIHEIRTEGVSPAIAINEAVSLAREYGTDRSAAFVNSVLDDARALITNPQSAQANPDPEPNPDPDSNPLTPPNTAPDTAHHGPNPLNP